MQPPKWIGNNRYKIIRTLGSGGSSTVYSAIDKKDKDEPEVAIKLLGQLPNQNPEYQKEFFNREVGALSRLSHSTIIKLLNSGDDEENQVLYLVLEYIENAQPLRDLVPKWKPDLLACINLLIELLEGISYAHQSSIIHRDLNPKNILMSNGSPKIIDFGISKILATLTAGQTVGDFFTRPYAAPEQVAYKNIEYNADVYSLAAIFYFLFTQKDPSLTVALSEQIRVLSTIPSEVRQIIERMADDSASKRYPTANQAMLDLRSVKRDLESKEQKFYVQLTKSAISKLSRQKGINEIEIQKLVEDAFASDVYLSNVSVKDGGGYHLIGDSMSLHCKIDSKILSRPYFCALTIDLSIPPHVIERRRKQGTCVFGQWKIGLPSSPLPSDLTPLNSFLDTVDASLQDKAIEKETRERRENLVETWNNILYLDRKLQDQSIKRLKYSNWELTENGAVVKALLHSDISSDDLFSREQSLSISSTKNKPMPVGSYLRQEENFIVIAKSPDVNPKRIAKSGEITANNTQWSVSWERQRNALDTIVDLHCANPRLPDVLINPENAKQDIEEYIEQYFNSDLDESKKEAVNAALKALDLYLIQGPPGTGKTVLISEIIMQILSRNPKTRILLVSQSNVAVDHALTKVSEVLKTHNFLGADIRLVRIGERGTKEYFVSEMLTQWTKEVRKKSQQYIETRCIKSDERHELELYLDILQTDVLPKQASKDQNGEDLMVSLEDFREKFANIEIKPTKRSLENLQEHIQQQINAQKTPLELLLEDWLKWTNKQDSFQEAYLEECSVITGTCVGFASERNLPTWFDWVIVDEAGRATPTEILISLVRGKRSILVGDHKQLPPVVDHDLYKKAVERIDIDSSWLEQTLFEYLFKQLRPELKTILKIQYRMHPHIAHLVSKVFYQEENLETGIALENRLHGWERWLTAVVWYSTSQLDDHEEKGGDSKFNLCEVNIILKQLEDLENNLRKRKQQKTVAVISGYIAQVEQLKRQLDIEDKNRWRALKIEVNTVDAFQGQEQDIVFYSVVRSNRKREIGFLKDIRRLNVALSRARELLVIIGDHRMANEAIVRDGANPFKAVITHIAANPAECTLVEAKDEFR